MVCSLASMATQIARMETGNGRYLINIVSVSAVCLFVCSFFCFLVVICCFVVRCVHSSFFLSEFWSLWVESTCFVFFPWRCPWSVFVESSSLPSLAVQCFCWFGFCRLFWSVESIALPVSAIHDDDEGCDVSNTVWWVTFIMLCPHSFLSTSFLLWCYWHKEYSLDILFWFPLNSNCAHMVLSYPCLIGLSVSLYWKQSLVWFNLYQYCHWSLEANQGFSFLLSPSPCVHRDFFFLWCI